MATYTPLDYAVALVILFVIMWLASKYLFTRIALDRYFIYAMIPVIVFALSVRVLVDAGVFEKSKLWSVTPGIHIVGTIFGLTVIFGGKILEKVKNIHYWKGAFALGTPVALYFSILLFRKMENPLFILQPFLLAAILTWAIYIISNFAAPLQMFRERVNLAIIFGHMLDGSATFIGIDRYGFSEEHILPEILINASGTAFVMIPLKIVVVLGALYLLDKWKEEEEGSDLYYKMVKFVFFIFGFGPGTRDALLLGL
jgi:uncharacterized membrane protein